MTPNAPAPALGRPIVTLGDAQRELLAKGLQINRRLNLLGAFAPEQVGLLNPVAGDCWIETNSTDTFFVIQLSTQPRLRVLCPGTWENA